MMGGVADLKITRIFPTCYTTQCFFSFKYHFSFSYSYSVGGIFVSVLTFMFVNVVRLMTTLSK